MGDVFSNLLTGFQNALTLTNIGFGFLGVFIGTLVGVIPGIGPINAIALLIPLSFGLDPVTGLILLTGVYYGSMYGGSTTSILVRTPGEVASIVTTLDGYEMARQGRAGPALSTAAIGSFIAGTLALVGLMFLAPVIAKAAYYFGSAEYFLLIILAMSMISSLSTGSALKGYISVFIGLAVATVGIDPQSGINRFTFGITNLLDGIDFILFSIALFAIPEALSNIGKKKLETKMQIQKIKGSLWMNREDWKRSIGPYGRGSVLGFLIGALPGIGPSLASFMSYAMEKKISKHPEKFGKGAIEGVSGPEAANNAGVGGALVPLFTLGIPGSATTALLLYVFMMYGLQPGPGMFETNSTLIWAIIASMYVGNVILLLLNLPLVGLFASLLKIPLVPLFVGVLAFSVLGVYSINFNSFDLILLFIFGLVGYGMQYFNIPLAPAVMALVLGGLMEENFRRTMNISNGNIFVFFERPVSIALIIVIVLVVIVPGILSIMKKRRQKNASAEEGINIS
ncbi:tripartite tricarboxylate transporter permease [Caldibacillus lycopersici]|uniref:Tripartite tricarboxylate transporter permease n=1 Tax=Perspicuibacillus lycopersici TaxID=1325689 RepID=A0AAE3LSE2_9BACI|nr:tripartite tricarboxylate transporter permease [Perspicuibacillus lycopersici]MCU9612643.1 tripartite tricarboxylate transporter permease [Perspicuibacillus lycopersici]